MEYGIALVAIFVVSFLLGSIPFGVVVSKFMFNDDVREHGSGNIGTTNMMRTYGKKAGVIVFLCDFFKGVLAGLVALGVYCALDGANMLPAAESITFPFVTVDCLLDIATSISFAGCVWGHIFSPWLNFKGGKGIATAVGNEFVMYGPIPAIIELLIFAILVPITKYVSFGSVAAALACVPIAVIVFWGNPVAVIFASAGALTVVWAHRGNIKRLLNGTERRIGAKKE